MKYANERAHGIALLREHARQRVTSTDVRETHAELMSAMQALLDEFRTEFDVPGVRYWMLGAGQMEVYTTTAAHERPPPTDPPAIELARHEFLARAGLQFGYSDGL